MVVTKTPREVDLEQYQAALSASHASGLTYLEQLTAQAAKRCKVENLPYLYLVDDNTKTVLWIRPKCKKWDCTSCGADNARRWIARVIDGCNNLPPERWYFATLTAHRRIRDPARSLKTIRHGWSLLRKRWARRVDELYYVRVWEAHKDGAFHMHAITNYDGMNVRIKDDAAAAGLGYQARLDETKNAGQVAGYISKYMLKSLPLATEYPKGSRRIEVSRNWVKWREYENDDDWQLAKNEVVALLKIQAYEAAGYENKNAGKIKINARKKSNE